MTATFTRCLIDTAVYMGASADRTCPVLAETTPTPGLAVIPHLAASSGDPKAGGFTGGWAVLHLASHRTVTPAVGGLAQARHQAGLLGALSIDWTAPGEQIKNAADADPRITSAILATHYDAYAFGSESEEDDDDDC